MQIHYKAAESRNKPLEIDEELSSRGVYLRKDIQEVIFEDTDGTKQTKWTYSEAFLSTEDYKRYKLVQDITNAVEIKQEESIIDNYTMQLIEEGVL